MCRVNVFEQCKVYMIQNQPILWRNCFFLQIYYFFSTFHRNIINAWYDNLFLRTTIYSNEISQTYRGNKSQPEKLCSLLNEKKRCYWPTRICVCYKLWKRKCVKTRSSIRCNLLKWQQHQNCDTRSNKQTRKNKLFM